MVDGIAAASMEHILGLMGLAGKRDVEALEARLGLGEKDQEMD